MTQQQPTLQQALNQGSQLLQSGQLEQAQRLVELLIERFPEQIAVRLFAADTAMMSGDVAAAASSLEAVPESAPDYVRVILYKARLAFADARRAEAMQLAETAREGVAGNPELMRMLASIMRDCQQMEQAHKLLLQALQLAPEHVGLLYDVAMAEYHLNEPDAGEGHLAALLQKAPYHAGALHLRSALRTQSAERNHIGDLQQTLAKGPEQPQVLAAANYALAKELEDLGNYEESVLALEAGARAYRSTLRYDLGPELAAHEEIRNTFNQARFAELPSGFSQEQPIFVVGMPRTGTTLAERIIATHSQAVSIGEFTEFPRLYGQRLQAQLERNANSSPSEAALHIDFAELGQAYCTAARDLAGEASVFVDKLPFNFLYCGYILAALPNARLIHLVRDPLDTCYAIYKTLFFGAYSFSYDLDELASYYISYHQHMAHWRTVMPGRILDVHYEDLVRDPENQARRIIEWCGLPWESAVLDFHRRKDAALTASAMQVRQPVHTASIGSWRRAKTLLEPLQARFAAAGLI